MIGQNNIMGLQRMSVINLGIRIGFVAILRCKSDDVAELIHFY